MPLDIALIIAVVLPVLVLVFLRINAAMVFLSLCLGTALVKYVADDKSSFIGFIVPHTGTLSHTTVQLLLLFAPAVLTSAIMLFGIQGKLKVTLNALPALGTAMFAVLLAVPLLTPGLRHNLQVLELWHQLEVLQSVIVGATAALSLVFLWSQRKHARRPDHGKH